MTGNFPSRRSARIAPAIGKAYTPAMNRCATAVAFAFAPSVWACVSVDSAANCT